MEEISSSSASSSTILLSSSPAIDRYNPIIRDSTRNAKPFSSCNTYDQPPISSKTHKIQYKKKNKKIPLKENGDQAKIKNFDYTDKLNDEKKITSTEVTNYGNTSSGWSRTKNGDLITPPSSTRYLLSSHNEVYFNSGLSDFDPVLKLFPGETSKSKAVKTDQVYDETPPQNLPPPPPPPPPTPTPTPLPPPSSYFPAEQVVVLRVSLHCRGCERKMRKHISKMEGVTSFHIDFAAKKVTVTGNVTPLSVLSSISKVKNAQLWPPTISSSSIPTAVNLSNSEFNNGYKGAGA